MSRHANISIGVITNPNSKKNRARKDRAAELQQIVGARGIVRETASVAEIRPVIDEFLARDVRYWVSDGGDGALHWLVNEARGTLGERGLALPLTVPTNGGTIDFVAKKVGIRGQADQILRRLVAAEESGREIPIVEVPSFIMTGERREANGSLAPFEKLGFLTAVAGIGQRFFGIYYSYPAPGAETISRIIAKGVASMTLNLPVIDRIPVPASVKGYIHKLITPQRARVRLDGRLLENEAWRCVHVGTFFADIGGVVRLFPVAGNGKLNAMVGNPDIFQIFRNLPNLFRGTPMSGGVEDIAATEVEVEALGDELLNPCIDGEMFTDIVRLKIAPGPLVKVPKIDCGG
jgi:diacylglycerol kinase family enzyme